MMHCIDCIYLNFSFIDYLSLLFDWLMMMIIDYLKAHIGK